MLNSRPGIAAYGDTTMRATLVRIAHSHAIEDIP